MLNQVQETAGRADTQPMQGETPLPATTEAAAEVPSARQVVADTWADAADASGTVKATREMPEPDSFGG